MIYVFDTSSLRALQYFYPAVFKQIWENLDKLITQQTFISCREVLNELEKQNISNDLSRWAKKNKNIFTMPSHEEFNFVREIFQIRHFQGLIGEKQRLKGMPVADPFVIACAKVKKGTVVTEERFADNGAKIPNVCIHFKIPCVNLEGFMQNQGWRF